MHCLLLWLTLHIRLGISISHLSIPGIVPIPGVIYPIIFNTFFFFLPAVVLNCFSCSTCILQTRINLTSFLFKSKFISFPICDFSHFLSHYYYYYNYYFYYYLLLFFFYMFCCFVIISNFFYLVMSRYH